MQRYNIELNALIGAAMVKSENGHYVLHSEAQTELTAALDEGKAQFDRAKRWEIAAGDAIIERNELKDKYSREVLGLNNEGDPIGGEPAGGLLADLKWMTLK